MRAYYQDATTTIYHGDCREVMPRLDRVDAVITDPPYGETSLDWDCWPEGWVNLLEPLTNCLWCFGSMRLFLARRDDFARWEFAQDIVWEKHNGSGLHADRFRRVHECVAQFYRGPWGQIHKQPVKTYDANNISVTRKTRPKHWGGVGESSYESHEGGPRLMRSVIFCRSCHGQALHPTQKPEGIIRPLLEYSVPVGGLVLDPFMGSGTTLRVAADLGRRSIGIEADERQCENAVRRLSQSTLDLTHRSENAALFAGR